MSNNLTAVRQQLKIKSLLQGQGLQDSHNMLFV